MHPHNSSSYSGTMLTHAPDNLGTDKFGILLLYELYILEQAGGLLCSAACVT